MHGPTVVFVYLLAAPPAYKQSLRGFRARIRVSHEDFITAVALHALCMLAAHDIYTIS
jgi:hypothetical protein